ncbi:MAG: SAM-dependent chlorinase/fluorinase [Planctomycetes bacterium]|nr:SAM-dependent chlorinase/fluorinase [Planctomycetota bacterium]
MNATARVAGSLVLALIAPSCGLLPRPLGCADRTGSVVYLTDFDTMDGAVASMKGVARAVDARLDLLDLTHRIPPFDIWTASLRLRQTVPYWPSDSVFVCVVDPGVGTDRLPIVAIDHVGHRIVTPDNGTLTFLAREVGLSAAYAIDVERFHRPGADVTATFHGRDVFSYVGALLAAGEIEAREVGDSIPVERLVLLAVPEPTFDDATGARSMRGIVEVIDEPYGNVWTNLPIAFVRGAGIEPGTVLNVTIETGDAGAARTVFAGAVPFCATFGDVPRGAPLAYLNSLDRIAFALNMGDFARTHGIAAGPAWRVRVERTGTH